LIIAEGGNDLSWWSGNLYLVKWVGSYNIFRNKPREEDPNATQVAIDGMSGDAPILDVVEAMAREASFLPQIENKGSDFTMTDLSHICAYSSRAEKVCKIIYAIGDDGYGIRAFSLGGGAELITVEQTSYVGAKI
jgi:hypothetical protein